MKTTHGIFGFVIAAVAFCGCDAPLPVMLPELPLSEVTPYFSEAAEVKAIDTAYYQVHDAEGNKIGTVLLTEPYSATVNGYNGPTPLLIALDADDRITDVAPMANQETPRYAQRVADGGLYGAWDGLHVDEALALEVDAISGATYTSNGVKNSLALRLKAYQRQLAKDHSANPTRSWVKLFKRKP